MKFLIESVNNCNVIKDDHCGISFYDDLFDPKEVNYMRFEKGIIGHIEMMTCNEYFEHCRKIFSGRDPYKGLDMKAVKEYSDMMRNGTKFNTPYLNWHNYFGPGQEGRHRMLAMKEVCGEDAKAPVLWCEEYVPDDKEIEEYVSKKYGSNNQAWGIRYINSCLDKYLDRIKEDPKEIEIETCKGYELEEGNIIDYGQGWAKIDNIKMLERDLNEIEATLIKEDEDVVYYIEDFEEVKRQKQLLY